MDPEKEQFRLYIFTRWKLGDAPTKIFADLQVVYGANCLSYRTICRWVDRFREGQEDVKDDYRCGRPRTERTERSILSVKNLVESDPLISIREISDKCGLSHSTVEKILDEDLNLKKISSGWIPHLLNEEQKIQRVKCSVQLQQMFQPHGNKRLSDVVTGNETWFYFYGIPNKRANQVWVGPDDPRPVVLRPYFQSRKSLYSIFFDVNGPVAAHILPEKSTLTATYYVNTVLPKVVQSVCEARPTIGTRQTLLLHDNTSAHKAKVTVTYLQQQGISTLPHAPYSPSPDLAPCDLLVVPKTEGETRGHQISEGAGPRKSREYRSQGHPSK